MKFALWLGLLAATAVGLLGFHADVLSGRRFYIHDSLVLMTSLHLFNAPVVNGELPLWGVAMNGGEPLWPLAELYAGGDPVALLAWGGARLFGGTSLQAFHFTMVGWLFVFSLGMVKLFRLYSRRPEAAWLVFGLSFFGPLAWSLALQAQGFLTPFRYSPWVVWAVICFLQMPSARSALVAAFWVVVSAAGYQTPYAFYFYGWFVLIYLLNHRELLRKETLRWTAVGFPIVLLGFAPLLATFLKLKTLFPIARELTPNAAWFFDFKALYMGFFQPITWGEHGSTGIGYLSTILLLVGIVTALKQKGLPRVFLYSLIPLVPLCCAGNGDLRFAAGNFTFFGVRNWGFLLTPIQMCVFFLAGVGLVRLEEILKPKIAMMIVAVATLGELHYWSTHQHHAMELTADLKSRVPPMQIDSSPVLSERPWLFDASKYVPFAYQGSTVQGLPTAYTFPIFETYGLENPARLGLTTMTHSLRLPRYQKLAEATQISQNVKEAIFGVSVPSLRLLSDAQACPSLDETLTFLSQKGTLTTCVEGPGPYHFSRTPLDFHVVSATHNRLEISLDHPETRGVLVYADNYDTDWRAEIDGRAVPVVPANVTNKAVIIDQPSQTVVMTYRPWGYLFSFGARIFITLAAAGILLYLRLSPRLRARSV